MQERGRFYKGHKVLCPCVYGVAGFEGGGRECGS